MDTTLQELKNYGADIVGAMERFLDDVDLYKMCFATFLDDEAFAKLGDALSKDDYEQAFEQAHSLKGVAGNMGLTPMYELFSEMVEAMRRKDYTKLGENYAEVSLQLDKLKAMNK